MKKLAVLFTLITVIAVMTSMMLVPAYADETDANGNVVTSAVEHDHDGDGVADHDADAHVDETTPETDAGTDTTADNTTTESETTATAVEHDHDGDGVADHAVEEHGTVTWDNLGTSGIIAIAVAVVLLVATVTVIVLLIPKRGKQK